MTPTSDATANAEVDFDHHSLDFAHRPFETFAALRAQGQVVRSEHHGGFWAILGHAEVSDAAVDVTRFSSVHDLAPDSELLGLQIPPAQSRTGFIELDGSEHLAWRKVFNPMLSPAAVAKYTSAITELADEAIDSVIDLDEFDIVEDLASQVPSKITMMQLGLPLDLGPKYAHFLHLGIGSPPDADLSEVMEERNAIFGGIMATVLERKDDPSGDDLISLMWRSTVEGHEITIDDISEQVGLILAGGIDTTSSLITNTMMWLADHPVERDLLAADPTRWDLATEEFLRYFSPVLSLARTTTEVCPVGQRELAAHDRALLCWGAANHDPAEFADPETVVIDRFPNRHVAFGVGAHRCIGSNIARIVFKGAMQQIVARMPDYEVFVDRAVKYPSVSVANGWLHVPARVRRGSADD